MNTKELDRVLKSYTFTKKEFCGVLPIDNLPLKKVQRPCSFIVNTDISSLPGKHWFAIYLPRKGKIEYFDSFGYKPLNKEVYLFLKKNGNWTYNNLQLQNSNSNSCGKFCALYVAYRSKGLTKKDFINIFSADTINNEIIVKILFKKLYNFI